MHGGDGATGPEFPCTPARRPPCRTGRVIAVCVQHGDRKAACRSTTPGTVATRRASSGQVLAENRQEQHVAQYVIPALRRNMGGGIQLYAPHGSGPWQGVVVLHVGGVG